MTDAANLDGVGIRADEEEAVITHAQPELVPPFCGPSHYPRPTLQNDEVRKKLASRRIA